MWLLSEYTQGAERKGRASLHPILISHVQVTQMVASKMNLLGLVLLLACLGQEAWAVKLKIKHEECLMHQFEMYEPFYGNFVSLPDVYHHQALYTLIITSPAGTKVHETTRANEGRFHLVPYESGTYKFCLTDTDYHHHGRYHTDKEVVWELFVGHGDYTSDHAKEHDAQSLWHYVHLVDAQLQQLRSTLSYMYWRERRHRMTVDSTNKRVVWYAVLRACALVLVSALQVVGVRYLFRSK